MGMPSEVTQALRHELAFKALTLFLHDGGATRPANDSIKYNL